MDNNEVSWPKAVQQKIVDHIFGQQVPPDVAERMGLLHNANTIYTRLVQKALNEKGTNQPADQASVGQVGNTGAVQQSPVQAPSESMPEDGLLRSPKTLSERGR